jgi:hypothetical protein
MIYDSGDAEALRLIRAFHKISDPEARRIIIQIVEATAQGAAPKVKEQETRPSRGRC